MYCKAIRWIRRWRVLLGQAGNSGTAGTANTGSGVAGSAGDNTNQRWCKLEEVQEDAGMGANGGSRYRYHYKVKIVYKEIL